jgi:type VI secretion system protein ImpH
MGSKLWDKKLPLKEELRNDANLFSFEMASYILEHGAQTSFGKETNIVHAPFRTVSVNSFHLRWSEIVKIQEIGNINTIYTGRLAIFGLNAPLPTPYSELIFRRAFEKDFAMADFINIFNSRLLGISYQISKRRYVALQNHRDENCMLVKSMATFVGECPEKMKKQLASIAYLFWIKEKSASGLESLITFIFKFETTVKQFRLFWTDVCENNALKGNVKLGRNIVLGNKALISSLGVEIKLTHDKFEKILELITNDQYLENLKYLIKKYLGTLFSVHISVVPKNVPPLILNTDGKTILGRTSWFPSNRKSNIRFDPAKIIISEHQ